MFGETVKERLKLLETGSGDKPVEISDKEFHLIERGQGEADLTVSLSTQCILFKGLEKKKLQYFVNKKCADYVIFENKGGQWFVHILELKRSVGSDEWNTIKLQFAGALQNVYALAGVLGIHVEPENVKVYTVYRNDKINHTANPVKLRCGMNAREHNTESMEQAEWNAKQVEISFANTICVEHYKVNLNIENGTGKCQLA